jgi:hypothetical protein
MPRATVMEKHRNTDDQIAYSKEALEHDLFRIQSAWDESQSIRNRDAIYEYLTAVFDLVAWWAHRLRSAEDIALRYGLGPA